LIDTTREHSPLKQAKDALVLDNSNMSREEQLTIALQWAQERIGQTNNK
jgi:cytidylate kinase